MGPQGVKAALRAGANDLGGTLMDESITRAAGAVHGQELSPEQMQTVIRSIGRTPRQRTTLYGQAGNARVAAAFDAAPLAERINAPAKRFERRRVREGGQTVA
jgi:FO synthase